MTPEEWDRLKPLFEQALEMAPEDRSAFAEKVLLDHKELGHHLAALISAHERETVSIDKQSLKSHEPLPAERPWFSEGELVLDRFRIVRFLGCGGMGQVYEANDIQLGRVALKTIRPELASRQEMLVRFKQEVHLARKVTNPHVCRIHELFLVTGDDRHPPSAFLTMEFLAGTTLADRIERAGALPFQEAESIVAHLCIALQAIHDAGIVHRDFKSRNVMLVPRRGASQAVVMDLGLARETTNGTDAGSGITVPGAVVGTPEYMAPEQFEGRPATPATDIYALGIVLYEIATGSRPFQAPSPVAAAIRRAKHPPPPSSVNPDLPHQWDEVINRCLQYDAELRYQSATEVAEALRSKTSHTAKVRRTIAGFSFEQRAAIALSLFMVFLLVAGMLWYQWRVYPPPSPDAQRWYDEGTSALREGTFLKATQALGRAVELESDFVLARARLADAWAELDFTGKAQDEMLRASSLELRRSLPEIERRYLDAVRGTLTRDFSLAVQDYRAILRALPAKEKAYGYVDLGRAFERAGDVSEAIKNYSEAAKRAPEYPASFVRLGVLESRQGKNSEADAAFAHAESLYRSASNVEGIAEIDYQRGYAASLQGDLPRARTFLDKSLHAAQDIPSVQLEIRALTRRSVVESSANNGDKAIELATRAIQLARQRGLDYWAIDGLIRLGTAHLDRNEYAQAEPSFQEALRLAQESGRPRLEANARLSLASIRDQQGKPNETVTLAQDALAYYKKAGFLNESISALVLMIRAKQAKGDAQAALRLALQALEIAKKSNNSPAILQVEESVGGGFLDLQQYPDALSHFQSALAIAQATEENVEYETLHCADTLWRLGRYSDAEHMLSSLPAEIVKRPAIATDIKRILANIRLSQRNYAQALNLARKALAVRKGLAPATVAEFQIIGGIAQSKAGSAQQGGAFCQAALDDARQESYPEMTAEASLCCAAAHLAAGSIEKALPLAESANKFFSSSGQKESEWRSLLVLSSIHKKSGNSGSSVRLASKALDILSAFEHNWGFSTYQVYLSRPDIQADRQELARLLKG